MKVPSANQSIFVEILVAEFKKVLIFMECRLSPLFYASTAEKNLKIEK